MILDPNRYECPEHHADLTDLVEEALEEQVQVAYRPPRPGGRFQVIVTCPGADGKAPHPLICTGTRAK